MVPQKWQKLKEFRHFSILSQDFVTIRNSTPRHISCVDQSEEKRGACEK